MTISLPPFPSETRRFNSFSGLNTWRQSTVPYTFKGLYRIVAIKRISCHNSVHAAMVSRDDHRKLLHLLHQLHFQADRRNHCHSIPVTDGTSQSANWDYQGGDVFYGHVNQKLLPALYLHYRPKDTNVTERKIADISDKNCSHLRKYESMKCNQKCLV